MGTSQQSADYVVDQLSGVGDVTAKKVFAGEYGVYASGKLFALVCDNKLFIKPTEPGRDYLGADVVESPPYPGAKNSFLIEEAIDDREWLCELARLTIEALPKPKKKSAKKKARQKTAKKKAAKKKSVKRKAAKKKAAAKSTTRKKSVKRKKKGV